MGHYASEMSDTWMIWQEEFEKRKAAGFKRVNTLKETYECDVCGAIIADWRKHRTVCRSDEQMRKEK